VASDICTLTNETPRGRCLSGEAVGRPQNQEKTAWPTRAAAAIAPTGRSRVGVVPGRGVRTFPRIGATALIAQVDLPPAAAVLHVPATTAAVALERVDHVVMATTGVVPGHAVAVGIAVATIVPDPVAGPVPETHVPRVATARRVDRTSVRTAAGAGSHRRVRASRNPGSRTR
jgi:hypothetical protein